MSSLSLLTLAHTAALALALALAAALLAGALLAGVLLAGVLLALVLVLLQPARNAVATTQAAHSTLHPLAIMTAACKTIGPAASPASGEGQRGAQGSHETWPARSVQPMNQPRKAVR
jgi:hypothetical protein